MDGVLADRQRRDQQVEPEVDRVACQGPGPRRARSGRALDRTKLRRLAAVARDLLHRPTVDRRRQTGVLVDMPVRARAQRRRHRPVCCVARREPAARTRRLPPPAPRCRDRAARRQSDQIITALQDGLIDVGLVGDTDRQPAGIETQIVADEPLVAVVSTDHPLATLTAIALGKVKDQPLISLPRRTGLRLRLEQACATAGFTPRIAFEASDPRTLAALAAEGLGIAIITHAAAATYAPDV